MNARNRIWEEMKQAKANIIGIQKYVDQRRKCNRIVNAIIAFLAAIGALGESIYEKIPFITSILIGIVSIVKSIKPDLLQSDSELIELDGLHSFYSQYMNSLEEIWYDFDKDYKNEEETMCLFFKLKQTECDKEALLNKGLRRISKKMQKEIDKESEEYINRVYFKIQ